MTQTALVNPADITREQALARVDEFRRYFDPEHGGLTKQDVVGCAIMKLAFERPAKGASVRRETWFKCEVEALTLFLHAIPGDMRDIGFWPMIAVPRGQEHLLAEQARDAYLRWRDTFIAALRRDMRGEAPSEREKLLAGLFCKRICPHIPDEDERGAIRRVLERAVVWGSSAGRRPGHGYLEVGDVRNELWANPEAEMYRKADGSYCFDEKAMADRLRRVGLFPDRRASHTDDGVEEDQAAPLDAKAHIDAIKSALSPRERQAVDLELQGLSRKDIARRMGIGVGTLNAMWTRIKATARGLGEDEHDSRTA